MRSWIATLAVIVHLAAFAAYPQTTEFTYQGSLKDGANPATGNYDFEFLLFDAVSAGSQLGSTLTKNNVAVAAGIFSVALDFGNQFSGAARFLEIHVRPSGGGGFTNLLPRQPVTSGPYSIRSLNAGTAMNFAGPLAGDVTGTQGATVIANNAVTDAKINSVAGSKVTGTIPVAAVPPGSGNYIQNQNAAPQPSSNFNISGNGTAGGTLAGSIVNAVTQYNLGGSRVLTSPGTNNLFIGLNAAVTGPTGIDNTYVGNNAGNASTSGDANSFFGVSAGFNNQGSSNSFFGRSAGFQNTTGLNNSYFGVQAGRDSTDGAYNSFFGYQAGFGNLSGGRNALFGAQAGKFNTGSSNSFFGLGAGFNNTAGNGNSFFGDSAGLGNTTGSNNTAIGFATSFGSPNLTNATAIGSYARVDNINSLVLGSIAGVNGAPASTRVGIGTTVPLSSLEVSGDVFANCSFNSSCLQALNPVRPTKAAFASPNYAGYFFGTTFFQGDSTPLPSTSGAGIVVGFGSGASGGYISAYDYSAGTAKDLWLNNAGGRVGINTITPDQTLSVYGGASKPGGGSWANYSDERLKNIKGRYTTGLKAIMRLQPIRYEYKPDNALGIKLAGEHIGFGAKAVAEVIPEAVTKNDQGYLLINNDPIIWAAINAVKEQQAQIEAQSRQIASLRAANGTLQRRLRAVEEATGTRGGTARRRR